MSIQCEHSIGNDPRHLRTCLKCGKEVSGRWLRNPLRESTLAFRASKDPEFTESLVRFAQSRAGDGQVRSLLTRNFHREIREELSDALNYLCWLSDQKHVQGDEGLNAGELACLSHVCEAWKWLHVGGDE